MYHPKMSRFKERFNKMFNEIDSYIEDKYGHLYALHPARPARGQTADPKADGLFNIGADFTPGYGSKTGRGYLLDVHMATLERVRKEDRWRIIEDVVKKIKLLLPLYFPERKLEIFAEGDHFKIIGDFSLGSTSSDSASLPSSTHLNKRRK